MTFILYKLKASLQHEILVKDSFWSRQVGEKVYPITSCHKSKEVKGCIIQCYIVLWSISREMVIQKFFREESKTNPKSFKLKGHA